MLGINNTLFSFKRSKQKASTLSSASFIVHTVGFILKKKTKGSTIAGFYTGIVLGIFGSVNLFLLIQLLI